MRQKNFKKLTEKDILEIVESNKPTIVLHIQNIDCDIDANPEVYSNKDIDRLTDIIDHMAKDIWIDKTYVSFGKNRFKDAFIVEDKWYDFVKLISISTIHKIDRRGQRAIKESLLTIASVYLYQIAEKYGFDTENIDIQICGQSKIKSEIFKDDRTSWNF